MKLKNAKKSVLPTMPVFGKWYRDPNLKSKKESLRGLKNTHFCKYMAQNDYILKF